MIKNQAGQVINAQMINATTGAPFIGSVSVNVTVDAGAQTAGAGTVTSKGTGQYQYAPTQAETNGNSVAYQFVASGAVDVVVNVSPITLAQAASLGGTSIPGALIVSDLLTLALNRVNVLQQNESPGPDLLQDCLNYANFWIDSLSIENLMIPWRLRTTFPMVSGKASYTVGLGGDINIPKPTFLPASAGGTGQVTYIDGSLNPPIERTLQYLTDDAFTAIPIKGQTNPLPTFYYWQNWSDPASSPNMATLTFWLVPTSSVLTGVITAPSPIAQFGATTDVIILPPGWKFFMQENLAVMFAATFRENLPVDPNLLQSARESKAAVKRANTRLLESSVDPALTWRTPRSNIYTGN